MPPTMGDRIGQSRAGAPALLILLLAAASVWWVSGQVAQGRYSGILVAVVLFQALWVFARWRESVYTFMVYVIVEGFLINYFMVPELNLLKDVFVVALFAVLAVSTVPRGIFPIPRASWMLPFALFALLYTAQIFNPHLPNIVVGLVGLRVSLLYALLVPVGFWFFDSRERALRFFFFLTMLSFPVAAFGIFQYFIGPDWLTSLSTGFARAVFNSREDGTGYFRTISTFVQTGGFSIYLCFMMLVAVAQFYMPAMKLQKRWIGAAFMVQLMAALSSGGRAPMAMFLVAVILLMLMKGRLAKLLPVLALTAAVFIGSVLVLGPAVAERFGTLLNLENVQARNVPLVYGWLYEAMQTDPAGMGAGYATVASRHAGATPLNNSAVENMLARIRFETGLPGMVLYIIFILAVVRECIRVPQRTADRDLSWLVSACAAFLLVNIFLSLPWGTPFDVSPTNVYLWFFLGFLARAPYLCLAEQRETPKIASRETAELRDEAAVSS